MLAARQCPPKLLYHSLSWGENTMKGSWVKTRAGRDHSPVTVMAKIDLT